MPEPSRVPEGFSEEAVLNPQGGEALRAAVRRWRRRFASSLGPSQREGKIGLPRANPRGRLRTDELMFSNCDPGEDS